MIVLKQALNILFSELRWWIPYGPLRGGGPLRHVRYDRFDLHRVRWPRVPSLSTSTTTTAFTTADRRRLCCQASAEYAQHGRELERRQLVWGLRSVALNLNFCSETKKKRKKKNPKTCHNAKNLHPFVVRINFVLSGIIILTIIVWNWKILPMFYAMTLVG